MPDWQIIATLVCLILAGHFLTRRLLKLKKGDDHQGCGSCGANPNAAKAKPIVPLDVPDQRR